MAIAPHAPQPDGDGYCRACPLPLANKVHVSGVIYMAPVGTPIEEMTNEEHIIGVTDEPIVLGATTDPIRVRSYTPAAVALDGAETSADAAAAVEPRRGQLRAAILDLLDRHPEGLTDDQLEQLLGESHQTVSSARNALMRDLAVTKRLDGKGDVVKRETRTGRPALVWVRRRAAA